MYYNNTSSRSAIIVHWILLLFVVVLIDNNNNNHNVMFQKSNVFVEAFIVLPSTTTTTTTLSKTKTKKKNHFFMTAVSDDDDNDANIERAWRYIKKPLLSIGAKGAKSSQGNSLKNLLHDHQLVKVKIVNTRPFDGSYENAFNVLRDLAIENGSSKDLELIQIRESEKIILIGMPGMLKEIQNGTYPPPPPPPPKPEITST